MILSNPESTNAPIRDFITHKAKWSLGAGEAADFPDEVAEVLLRTYPFLQVLNENGEVIREGNGEVKVKGPIHDVILQGDIAIIDGIRYIKEVNVSTEDKNDTAPSLVDVEPDIEPEPDLEVDASIDDGKKKAHQTKEEESSPEDKK